MHVSFCLKQKAKMMEVYAYIKKVNHSALDFSLHASVHKVVFKNFICLEKQFKTTTHINTLAVKTIPESCLFE